MKILVVDPGHGGRDPGASGNGLVEKNLTLDIAKKVRSALSSHQVDVRLTRESDVDLSLADRVAYANNLNAGYFLSIHVNAGGGTGFESYVHTAASAFASERQIILHQVVGNFYKQKGFLDRGRKSANFAVLRETRMPAVLLENLFIDCKKDALALADGRFLTELVQAIAAGLAAALKLERKQERSQERSQEWDPQQEIAQLKQAGLITGDHEAKDLVTWGEFATVINRLR